LYCGFASGTRSVIASYAITFCGAYFLTKPKINIGQILLIGVPIIAIMLVSTVYMLEFRTVGLSNFSFGNNQYDTIFIDQNIVVISQLIEIFPGSGDFLGFEVPINALIRPVPRLLWPGKPEGLSTSIEAALGGGPGMTISCTFVGEAYMAGGFPGVLVAGLVFGAVAEMWNRVGRNINSPVKQLLYASGLLCAAFAIRSMLGMVPPMLPTFGLWLYIRYWLPSIPQPPIVRSRRF
jgi:oligosaccharide repeat unit polymerase